MARCSSLRSKTLPRPEHPTTRWDRQEAGCGKCPALLVVVCWFALGPLASILPCPWECSRRACQPGPSCTCILEVCLEEEWNSWS